MDDRPPVQLAMPFDAGAEPPPVVPRAEDEIPTAGVFRDIAVL